MRKCPQLYYDMYNNSFKGNVTKKYIQDNHDISTLILDNKKQVNIWAYDEIHLYDSILVGDYIFKKKNDLKCYLIRDKDTILYEIIQPECSKLK